MQTLGWLTNTDPRSLERVTVASGNILLVRSDDSLDQYAAIKSVAQSLNIVGLVGAGFQVTKPTANSSLTYISLWVPTVNGQPVEVDDNVFLTVRPATAKETAAVGASLARVPGIQEVGLGVSPSSSSSFGVKGVGLLAAAFIAGLWLGRR